MRKLILLGSFFLLCFAGFNDDDLDGVPNNLDKCPNTAFLEIVNKEGCSSNQIKKSSLKFNISIGYEYDKYKSYNDIQIISTFISARKNNLKTSLFYSIMKDNGNYSSNDLIGSLYYYFYPNNKILIKSGAKLYFPTSYNKKIDYAFLLEGVYYFKNFDISLNEKHKIYGESGTKQKDIITLSIGANYKRLYISPYLYTENSIYNTSKWYKYAGIMFSYSITNKIGLTFDSSTDIDETSNYSMNISLGYSF